MSDFPLPFDQLTLDQRLVMTQYERLCNMASVLGIPLPEPEVPDLADDETFEPTSFSHYLLADSFRLDLGIACWDDEEAGPVVGLAFRFGDNGNRVELSFSAGAAGWIGEATLEDESMDWAPIMALAKNLEVSRDPDCEASQLEEGTALRVAERMFLHYLAHRLPH